ncbi:MAG TPA: hypothetical protein VMV88_06955 [Gallionella sp.]|nr:hypothetical protein [Gallionella sp.]
MTISSDQFKNIASMLVAMPGGENPLPSVRASFPDIKVTRCAADDMRGETPFFRAGDFDVFLVDTKNLCWKIIDEPTSATGLILAARH